MRLLAILGIMTALLVGCSHNTTSLSAWLGTEKVEVRYLMSDGTWINADSLSWSDRSWYRELRFDTDGDGVWNYLYAEVYDDVAGWIWIPSTARVNPEEEPELARDRRYLIRCQDDPPCQPSLDDFGYGRH
jgi:hypothetical protein